jgi:hypothetical protein
MRLYGMGREDSRRSTHKTGIILRLRPPDRRRNTHKITRNEHKPSPIKIGQRDPEQIAESENQDRHAGELDHVRQGAVEVLDVVAEHGRQREGAEALAEAAVEGVGDGEDFPRCVPVLCSPPGLASQAPSSPRGERLHVVL